MNIERKYWIIAGIVGGVILVLLALIAASNNMAVNYDENIKTTKADITVKEKRRVDLITRLVDVVEQSTQYEQSTLTMVTEMRTAVKQGNYDNAQLMINAVAEAYPTLQANSNFVTLMNELSVTENMIADARMAYNDSVKEYRRFVRRFPTNILLGLSGYVVEDYSYLEYSSQDTQMPENLFDNNK